MYLRMHVLFRYNMVRVLSKPCFADVKNHVFQNIVKSKSPKTKKEEEGNKGKKT